MEAVEQGTAQLGPGARVAAAYTSPTRLFADLLRNSAWWPIFLLYVVTGLLFCTAVQKQVGWSRAYDNVLHQTPAQEQQLAQLSPEQAAKQKAIGTKITSSIAWGYSLLLLLTSAIATAVLLGTLNFAFGGQARFGTLYAAYLYAAAPLALKSVLASLTLFAGLDAGSFLLSNPLGSNVGYYLPPDSAKWLLSLATSLDLFTFWMLALLTLGCSIVAKVSRASAAVAVWGWWLIITLAGVAIAAVRG